MAEAQSERHSVGRKGTDPEQKKLQEGEITRGSGKQEARKGSLKGNRGDKARRGNQIRRSGGGRRPGAQKTQPGRLCSDMWVLSITVEQGFKLGKGAQQRWGGAHLFS